MRGEQEQIEALLRGDVTAWVSEQLSAPDALDDLDYHDFFSVTVDALVAYLVAHGAPIGALWMPGQPPTEKNDRLVVEPAAGAWAVYYADHGDRYDERAHGTRDAALRDAVSRLCDAAWVSLNHRYWHAHHPELATLPAFNTPWPRPKASAP